LSGDNEAVKKLLTQLRLVAYVFVATLLLLEIGVRFSGYSEHHMSDPIYTSVSPSKDIPYVHKANLVSARARGLAVINTDSLGLRSEAAGAQYGPKTENEYRIAVAGDSVTFGEGIHRTEDTFCAMLERELNRAQNKIKVRVFNYGVSAYSVKQMTAILKHRMQEIDPDFVMMAIGPTDFDLSRTPSVDSKGNLIVNNPSVFFPRDSVHRQILRKMHLVYLVRELGSRWFDRKPSVRERLINGEIPESYKYIVQFKEIAEDYGIRYAIVLLPFPESKMNPLKTQLQKDKISFLDLSPLTNEFTLEEYKASAFDPHPSSKVHSRIGETLAHYFLSEGPLIAARQAGNL
jgi:lysophospholipase L1-like esterase